MTTLAASAVLKLALDAGFTRPHADVMVTIAWYESRWDPHATGDLSLSHFGSVGLWQIYTGAHTPSEVKVGIGPWTQALVNALQDPAVNARAAHIVFQEQGYRAWSTYNNYATSAAFQALVARVAALPDPSTPAPVPPVAPAPAPVPTAAVTNAENQIGKAEDHNECLVFVRTQFGVAAKYPTAIAGWDGAQYKHPGDTNPPASVPVWWSGGSTGDGHVAISVGGGNIVSSDIGTGQTVALVPLAAIHDTWGLTYLGWSEDLDGVRVYGTSPAPTPTPMPVPTPAPAPDPTVTITLIETAPGIWSVKP